MHQPDSLQKRVELVGMVGIVVVDVCAVEAALVFEPAARAVELCERCGCEPTDIATPERVAQVLNAEMQALGLSTARVMLNQAGTLADPTMADRFEAALNRPLIATSLQG